MDIKLAPGKYVVAVSGGVDSVVLLSMLVKQPNLELVVAHYDHGIRANSTEDRKFVEELANTYELSFFYETGNLGPKTSEALAREKRYEFLRNIKQQTGAEAIITAHHQDDLIETAIINLLRGTGRRGLSSLNSNSEIHRPLLTVPKSELLNYAKAHKLDWHEDSTNLDEKYLRNYVRRQIVPKLSIAERQKFLTILEEAANNNRTINDLLGGLLREHTTVTTLDLSWFIKLPHSLAREVMLAWLRQAGILSLDRRRVERIVVLAKTLSRGKLIDVDVANQLKIETTRLALQPRER